MSTVEGKSPFSQVAGWAHAEWVAGLTDDELIREAQYKRAVRSKQWLQITRLKAELEKRGLPIVEGL